MTGSWRVVVGFVLVWSFAESTHAQGVVPGGWANEFGYQSFANPNFAAGGFGYGGYGVASGQYGYGAGGPYTGSPYTGSPYPMGAGVSPYGVGVGGYPPMTSRPYAGVSPYGMTAFPAQTVNGTDALIDVIRHSVRRPARR